MDCAVLNIVENGDKVINISGGKFGERFIGITKCYTDKQITLPVEWGKAVDLNKLEEFLIENSDVKAVTFTMNETSTGILHPGKEIAEIAHKHGALVIVDGVTVVGGDYLYQDKWGLDIVAVGSQKCMGLPPGLAFISVRENIWDIIDKRKSKIPSYYLNLETMKKKWDKAKDTPFTSATHLILGLQESLKMMKEEGFENKINAGVVITGGSAYLSGLLEIADDIFAAPVRVGNPFGIGGLIDKVNTPEFSTSLGLIKYGLMDMKDRGMIKDKPMGFFQKFKEYFGF